MAADERERLESGLARRWLDLRDHLDERSRGLWLAAEARSLGYGGVAFVAAVTKVAKDTISDGIKELAGAVPPAGRVRRAGAGRRRAEQVDLRAAGGAGRAGGAGDLRGPRIAAAVDGQVAEHAGR